MVLTVAACRCLVAHLTHRITIALPRDVASEIVTISREAHANETRRDVFVRSAAAELLIGWHERHRDKKRITLASNRGAKSRLVCPHKHRTIANPTPSTRLPPYAARCTDVMMILLCFVSHSRITVSPPPRSVRQLKFQRLWVLHVPATAPDPPYVHGGGNGPVPAEAAEAALGASTRAEPKGCFVLSLRGLDEATGVPLGWPLARARSTIRY